MIQCNLRVCQSGLPNFKGLRIQIPSHFNFDYLSRMLENYDDKQIIDLLQFGFPLSHDGKTGSKLVPKNHGGACDWPKEIEKILNKEIAARAAIGPFNVSPFREETFLSPHNSVPKKDSQDRRLILDLSFPQGNSINDGIPKDEYLGHKEKLTLPSVDQLADRVTQIGKGAKIFKIDLSRAYRQIGLCPSAINWLGYVYKGKFILIALCQWVHAPAHGVASE